MPLRPVDMNLSTVMFHPRAAPSHAPVMPMAMPAQQIFNIQNYNVTIASTSEQSQRQPRALLPYQPFYPSEENIEFDLGLGLFEELQTF